MFKRKAIAITIASLACLILVSLVVAQVTKKQTKLRLVQQEKVRKQSEATLIQEGVMTPKQKKHSKIFKGYKDRSKVRDLIAQNGDVDLREEVGDVIAPSSFNLNSYLGSLYCNADAVVLGTVRSKSSQLTDDGKFIFTDYEFTPEDVFKNNAAAPVTSNIDITVTRTGGAIKLNGRTARAVDYRQMPLEVGERYLLFLKFVPETAAYGSLQSSRDDDSFQMVGERIVQQVSRNPLPFGGRRGMDKDAFMTEVRAAMNSACGN